MSDNICRYIPFSDKPDNIGILNFVLETDHAVIRDATVCTSYRICYVTGGKASFEMRGIESTLAFGDLFFLFPGVQYRLAPSDDDFRFEYISFIGRRASMELERAGVGVRNAVFHGYAQLNDLWQAGIVRSGQMLDATSEGILLLCLGAIAEHTAQSTTHTVDKTEQTVQEIKKYVDDHFSDASFGLNTLGEHFSYNKKYLAELFRKRTGIGISDYLMNVRIGYAKYLIDNQGYTGIKDIATLCGYTDPLYFSKVFKKHLGLSPREYIRTLPQDICRS